MATVALSALPASTTIATADILPADIGGVTKKITAGNFRTQLFAFGASDPINTGSITAVGNSTITGTLSGITTLTAANLVSSGTFTVSAGGITVSGGGITVTGNSTITGTLSAVTTLTAATGNLTVLAVTAGSTLRNLTLANDHNITDAITLSDTNAAPYTSWSIGLGTGGVGDGIGFYSGGAVRAILTPAGLFQAALLKISTNASQLIPGATSLSFRNNANSADNLIITDAGAATLRAGLTVSTGGITLTGSQTLSINGNQVVKSRQAGWSTPTGTQARTALTDASTTTDVLQHLMALVSDLEAHGLI